MKVVHRSRRGTLSILVLALLASFALSAVAAGSASAATQHWHRCVLAGGAKNFTDSACSKPTTAGLGSYGLQGGFESQEAAKVSATSNIHLNWENTSWAFDASCSTLTSENATATNPAGGGAATFGQAQPVTHLKLSNCSVLVNGQATICKVAEPIDLRVLGTATEFEGRPALKLEPRFGGEAFFYVTLKTCVSAENSFYGSITVKQNSNNDLEFTKSGSSLTSHGTPAWLTGTAKVENLGGSRLVLAP
jgi:hypothetical protein